MKQNSNDASYVHRLGGCLRVAPGAFLLLFLLIPDLLSCQSKNATPIPEFYGTYAVSDGKLVSIDSKSSQPIPVEAIKVGQHGDTYQICDRGAAVVPSPPKTINVASFSGNVEFLVFLQTSGEASAMRLAQSLKVGALGFVRNTAVNCGNGVRTGAEGGWETATRYVELRVKPVPGQQEMVVAVPSTPLDPGVYVLSGSSLQSVFQFEYWFAVSPASEAEKTKCVDLTVQFNRYQLMERGVLGQSVRPCSAGADSGTGSGNVSSAACSDFDSCMHGGRDAFRASDWSTAIADFRAAAGKNPSSGEPWALIGNTYLAAGRTDDLPNAWDKALTLGWSLSLPVCRERTMRPCEEGRLSLDTKKVALTTTSDQLVFSASPSDMHPAGRVTDIATVRFTVRNGKKNYQLDFIPYAVDCQEQTLVQCPQPGVEQQGAVANYVLGALSRLDSLGSASTQSGATGTPTKPPPPSCKQAADLGYSILLQGHLYKVQAIGSAGPDQKLVFLDETGRQVMDSGVLQQLAPAAWTRENVVVSQDARNGLTRVGGILGTSKAMQGYSTVQDAFARAMVEALEATVTDGASLTKLVPTLTTGIVTSQLKNAPRTLFVLTAQRGMEGSLAAYRQMQAVPLPPADATVLTAPDLAKIRAAYLQARTLELPYVALAAKLMPTTTAQLTNQALASAISEAVPSLGSGGTVKVTLESLLDFQKSLANLSSTLPALQAYSQNLNLALNLANANSRTVSDWATIQPSVCGAVPPSGR